MTIGVVSMIRDSWGGSEELWYEMAKVALKQGHKVIHLSYEHPVKHRKFEELESMGLIRITRPGYIRPDSTENQRLVQVGVNFLMKKIDPPFKKLFSHNPDIVVYNGTCYSIARESELLQEMKSHESTRYFIIAHLNNENIREIDNNEAEKVTTAYNKCNQVFFVSKRNLEAAKRHLYTEIPNASIIRNPVNLTSVELLPYPALNKTIQLGCVGNLVTVHKGQDILLDALSKWEFRNWNLNIYGYGTDREYLQKLVKHLRLQNQVNFHGSVNDIKEVWKRNHALLMPSHYEGMPLAIVEAMLCGRLCIATNVGGISEWITDEQNGFLCETASVGSLLKTLNKSISVLSEWENMGVRAHQAAMRLYDHDAGTTLLNRIIAQ